MMDKFARRIDKVMGRPLFNYIKSVRKHSPPSEEELSWSKAFHDLIKELAN